MVYRENQQRLPICQGGDFAKAEEMRISSHQSQVQNVSSRRQESVSQVLMCEWKLFRGEYDLTREWCLSQMSCSIGNPVAQFALNGYSAFTPENKRFPNADWRDPEFIF